jgi:hypothetical protein
VAQGLPPLAGAAFAADVIAMTGAAYLSHLRNGRAVALDDFKVHARAIRDRHGGGPAADEALINELMAPFRSR